MVLIYLTLPRTLFSRSGDAAPLCRRYGFGAHNRIATADQGLFYPKSVMRGLDGAVYHGDDCHVCHVKPLYGGSEAYYVAIAKMAGEFVVFH